MTPFAGRGVLLDIEGTLAPVAFVTQTLYPFAQTHLPDFLARRWDEPAVRRALELVAADAGATSLDAWLSGLDAQRQRDRVLVLLNDQIERDVKATGLKQLQGLVWEEGYRSGTLRSEIYPDVPPALRAWRERGLDVRIYSSGSVAAQRVFFAHTEAGDLTPLLNGHYDTTTGPKKSADSYRAVVTDMTLPPGEVLFVSDIPGELDAAREAGLRVLLVVRPGNAPVPDDGKYERVTSMADVVFA